MDSTQTIPYFLIPMKPNIGYSTLFSLLLLVVVSSVGSHAYGAEGGNGYVPGEIIIKIRPSISKGDQTQRAAQLIGRYGISEMQRAIYWKSDDQFRVDDPVGIGRIYVARVSPVVDIPRLAAELAADPIVEYAEPNAIVTADAVVPDDTLYGQEQHLPQVKAPEAWEIARGDSSVIIAVLDTGVDWDHPDLAGAIWRNEDEIPDNGIDDDANGFIDDIRGWDFVDDAPTGSDPTNADPTDDIDTTDNNPMDYQGHGTHVAGIAAAITNNITGIASLAWKATIMPLRMGYRTKDGNGRGTLLWMMQAFMYAGDNGAHAANLSFSTGNGSLVNDGARYAYLKGVVICNSAGNSASDFAGALGAQSFALSVASVGSNDRKAEYSSYNDLVDISAPGGASVDGGILSTIVTPSTFYHSPYTRFQGTSMASPLTASLAALLKSVHPDWTPAQIMFQITGTADNIDAINPQYIGKLGAGRINAYRALTETIAPPRPKISFVSITYDDSKEGNGNGFVDPGETGEIVVHLRNDWGDAQGVQVVLDSQSPVVSVENGLWSIGSLPGIADLASSEISNDTAPFRIHTHPQAVPMIATCTVTLTAGGGISMSEEIDLSVQPTVLFVDNELNSVDESMNLDYAMRTVLRDMNIPYAMWDRRTRGTPPLDVLQSYRIIVWGCEWVVPTLDIVDRTRLGEFLDAGGKLFITGQDIGWDLNDTAGSQYTSSGGTAGMWFESYLGCRYTGHDAVPQDDSARLSGIPGDPIGDGITVSVMQPGRLATDFRPDRLGELSGQAIFRYDDGAVAGIRYQSAGRVVYFPFGGLSTVPDLSLRSELFGRIVRWFEKAELTVTDVRDREDTASAITVEATVVAEEDTVLSVELFWDVDGAFPFNAVPMIPVGGGNYTGVIPAPNIDCDVTYYVVAKTTGAVFPVRFRRFHTGIDRIAPDAREINPLENSIERLGPFTVSMTATDNTYLDTADVYVFFHSDGATDDSVRMYATGAAGEFIGSFSLSTPRVSGSAVSYYLRVRDSSSQRNETRIPAQGYRTFLIGTEMIDDFERERPVWDYGLRWGRASNITRSGKYSMTDSPNGFSLVDTVNTLTLLRPLNLTGYDRAKLFFWKRHYFAGNDTLFVEHSLDGGNWTAGRIVRGVTTWLADSMDLPTGPGGDSVRLRFRMKNGKHLALFDGMYLEDVEVRTDVFLTGVAESDAGVPHSYELFQNYPNPFNPLTRIRFDLPEASVVTLRIFNILGQKVTEILDRQALDAGRHAVEFDGSGLSSGVYFFQLASDRFTRVKKMVLMR